MAYWIEIHCDTPLHLRPPGPDRRCDHSTGCIPGTAHTSAVRGQMVIAQMARERGYTYDRVNKWQCPNCQRGRRWEAVMTQKP